MTCHDFDRIWNEILDSETAGGRAGHTDAAGRECALLEHAARCPACGPMSARYEVLRRAIRMWGPPPRPSAGLAERILTEVKTTTGAARPVDHVVEHTRIWPIVAAMAAAAVLVMIPLPLLNRAMDRTRVNGPQIALHNTPAANRGRSNDGDNAYALNVALAEATAATWDLARSASEPAARISREALDAATSHGQSTAGPAASTGTGPATPTVSVPSLDSLVPDTAAAGAMLQQVGDRLTEGVRPLSDTARHAFGFLLGATPIKPDAHVNPPAQKGA